MNKVTQVNISGIAYVMNLDAYQRLENYLEALSRLFSQENEKEILQDIEIRIAELFNERLLPNRQIIELSVVIYVIEIIGTPESFGEMSNGDQDSTYADQNDRDNFREYKIKVGKRLYRNPEDKVIGGVASGISAYLGIKDPIWIRLLFIIAFPLSRGLSLAVYFILMFVMREAKTSKEKLEMRGDPINLENLKKSVEQEVDGISKKFKRFGAGSKTAPKNTINDQGHMTMPVALYEKIEDWLFRMGSGLEKIFKHIYKLAIPLLKIFGGVIIMALVVIWVAILASLIIGKPVIMMAMPSAPVIAHLGLFNIFAVVLMPVLGLLILVIQLFFGYRIPGSFLGVLIVFWMINLLSLAAVAAKTASEFSTPAAIVKDLLGAKEQPQRLYIKVEQKNPAHSIHLGNMSFDGQNAIFNLAELRIVRSEDQFYHLEEERVARGSDQIEAEINAQSIFGQARLVGDTLVLPGQISLAVRDKFRAQKLIFTLKVPDSGELYFDQYLGNLRVLPRFSEKAFLSGFDLLGKKLVIEQDSFSIESAQNN